MCSSDLINPSSSGGGTLQYIYDWKDGVSGVDAANASHSFAAGGKYNVQLIVKNAQGCFDTSYQLATVVSTPKADFSLAANEICEGDNLKIIDIQGAYSDPSATAKYNWSWGDGRTHVGKFALKTGLTRDTSILYSMYGDFVVKLKTSTSILGCGDSLWKSVSVYSMPKAKATVDQMAFCANMQNANFVNQSTNADGKKLQHFWDFGDGGMSNLSAPNHRFKTAGKFVVK